MTRGSTTACLALTASAFAAAPLAAAPPDPVVYVETTSGYAGAAHGGDLGESSTGSGFVLDVHAALEDGAARSTACRRPSTDDVLIVTNSHVIHAAVDVQVTFLWEAGGGAVRQVTAPGAVAGEDPLVDLALVRVSAHELRDRGLGVEEMAPLRLWTGAGFDLRQGTPVVALGNPHGFKRSVTQGVVSSALQEGGSWDTSFRHVQTDAAINPGNSGGPLVRADSHEVVGVSTWIDQGGQNLGFAVPVERVRAFLRQVACTAGPAHGLLPVIAEPVDERLRGLLHLPAETGAVIVGDLDVPTRARVALEPLDVVLEMRGGTSTHSGAAAEPVVIGRGGVPFAEAVFDRQPGSEVSLRTWRRGAIVDVPVTVQAADLGLVGPAHVLYLLGAFFENVPDGARRLLSYDGAGVLVGNVEPGSVAASAGLRKHDVVQRVVVNLDGQPRTHPIERLADLSPLAPVMEQAVGAALDGAPAARVVFFVFQADDRRHAVRVLDVGGPRR